MPGPKVLSETEALTLLQQGCLTPAVETTLGIPHANIPYASQELGLRRAPAVENLELNEVAAALKAERDLITENCEGCDN